MLSYNFLLLKSAPLTRVERKSLWLIFCSTYLDMYDIALYVGYGIYLAPILLAPTNIFSIYLIFALIFAAGQLAKLCGIFFFNRLIGNYTRNIILAPITIGLGYLMLALIPSYHLIGTYSIYLFLFIRIIQGFAFGFEIGFTINFANMNFNNNNKRFMYYFILFAGEVGSLVSIFLNRLLVSHGFSIESIDYIIRLQYFMGCLFIIFNLIFRVRHGEIKKNYSHFGQKCFFYTLVKKWHYILLRSGVLCLPVSLIIMAIFRAPNFLHSGLEINQLEINRLMLIMAGVAFVGTNCTKVLVRYTSAMKLLVISYVLICLFTLLSLAVDFNLYHPIFWTIFMSFSYGALIRLNPMVLYKVNDFHRHNRLTGRYLGHIFSYAFWGSVTVVYLDTSRYFTHNFHDSAPEIIIGVSTLISAVTLWRYVKNYHYT